MINTAHLSSLPQLTGSQKQIAWASEIRQQFIDLEVETTERINKRINKRVAKGVDAQVAEIALRKGHISKINFELLHSKKLGNLSDNISDDDALKAYDAALDYILAVTDAGWWINNRDIDNKWITALEAITE